MIPHQPSKSYSIRWISQVYKPSGSWGHVTHPVTRWKSQTSAEGTKRGNVGARKANAKRTIAPSYSCHVRDPNAHPSRWGQSTAITTSNSLDPLYLKKGKRENIPSFSSSSGQLSPCQASNLHCKLKAPFRFVNDICNVWTYGTSQRSVYVEPLSFVSLAVSLAIPAVSVCPCWEAPGEVAKMARTAQSWPFHQGQPGLKAYLPFSVSIITAYWKWIGCLLRYQLLV